jgi:hypothetical protein
MTLRVDFVALTLAISLVAGVCRADDERETKPRFKGVELYSWKDEKGDWIFALVSGTNRRKSEKEIKATKDPIRGTTALKKSLARLAEKEQVAWVDLGDGFELPPKATQQEIEKAAKDASVKLRLPNETDPP